MGENSSSLESRIAQLESQVLELDVRVAQITELLRTPPQNAAVSRKQPPVLSLCSKTTMPLKSC